MPGVFIAFIVLTVLAVLRVVGGVRRPHLPCKSWRVKCAALVSVWLVPLVWCWGGRRRRLCRLGMWV